MKENADISNKILISLWWSYVWRCTFYSILAGFVIGFITGIVFHAIGLYLLAANVAGFLGYVATIPISIIVLKIVLQKKYRSFEITVRDVEQESEVESDVKQAAFPSTLPEPISD